VRAKIALDLEEKLDLTTGILKPLGGKGRVPLFLPGISLVLGEKEMVVGFFCCGLFICIIFAVAQHERIIPSILSTFCLEKWSSLFSALYLDLLRKSEGDSMFLTFHIPFFCFFAFASSSFKIAL